MVVKGLLVEFRRKRELGNDDELDDGSGSRG